MRAASMTQGTRPQLIPAPLYWTGAGWVANALPPPACKKCGVSFVVRKSEGNPSERVGATRGGLEKERPSSTTAALRDPTTLHMHAIYIDSMARDVSPIRSSAQRSGPCSNAGRRQEDVLRTGPQQVQSSCNRRWGVDLLGCWPWSVVWRVDVAAFAGLRCASVVAGRRGRGRAQSGGN